MNRGLTVTFCALEALLVVGIGLGVALLPLSLLWAFEYGLQVDWAVFWRVAADAWLIGHGVEVHVPSLGDASQVLGVAAVESFDITIAALGFALVTLLLSVRAGRRIGATPHWRTGLVAAVATFAGLALVIVLSATHPTAVPSTVQAVALPTLVFLAGLAVGVRGARAGRGAVRTALTDLTDRVPFEVSVAAGVSLRSGAAAAAGVMAISAVATAVLIASRYAEIVGLYEAAHAGALGGAAITLAQLALTPNLAIWAAAWFIGPGFAIGVGSSVGPFATTLGTVPVIPVLGAVPAQAPEWGFVGLVVPIVAGFFAGVLGGRRLGTVLGGHASTLTRVGVGVGSGIIGGVIMFALAAFSGGSAGPGRLSVVGPDPWLVGLWTAVEFTVAVTIGILAGGPRRAE